MSQMLSSALANHALEIVGVEVPPLEEVIAQVFAQSAELRFDPHDSVSQIEVAGHD